MVCRTNHILWRSCNNRLCPQCGAEATAAWVRRELGKQVAAPYFLVTFTVPEEIRPLFFGDTAKACFDLFFCAADSALSKSLVRQDKTIRGPLGTKRSRGPGFAVSGVTAVLHTWNQQLLFHPHIHCIVPGAGLDATGRVVTVRNPQFLTRVEPLARAFKAAFRRGMDALGWQCDPAAWRRQWGVHVQACGDGAAAVKYLGRYVGRGPVGNGRILSMDAQNVTFRWKDRSNGGATATLTLPGVEFARRFLRHALPAGLRAIRYFGWCHPSAKKTRDRIRLRTGLPVVIKGTVDLRPQPELRENDPRRCSQ